MSQLQDQITQAIYNGGLCTGTAQPFDVSTATTHSSWGVYNPRNSGLNVILTSVSIIIASGTLQGQPILTQIVNGAAAPLYAYSRDRGGNTVPVPTALTSNGFLVLYSGLTPVLQALHDNSYVPAGNEYSFQTRAPLLPCENVYLQDAAPINQYFPLILYPGDFFGGAPGVNFLGSQIFLNFVQVSP